MNTPNNIVYAGSGLLFRVFLMLFMALGCSSLSANFSLVNDFQSGFGSTGWYSDNNSGSVSLVADPISGGSNMVASLVAGSSTGAHTRLFTPISITQAETKTLFFRFAQDESIEGIAGFFGASPLVAADAVTSASGSYGFGNVSAYLYYQNNAAPGPYPAGYSYRNGGNGGASVVASRENLTWYSVWMVIDNVNNTSDLYMEGGQFATQTLIADNFAFRNAGGIVDGDMGSFYVDRYQDNRFPTGVGAIYLDDIYIASGSELTTPVPEPSVYAAVLGLLAIVAVGMRRRRK